MKILIISDDSAFINTIDSYFQKRGHSSIIYKWLIKAMDNLEEIKPEVIIVSADEYPRHWKSLVQFMESGIAGNKFKIFLYKKTPFSEQDSQKITKLKISKIFSKLDEVTINNTFNHLFTSKTQSVAQTKKKIENVQNDNSLIITNPGTHNFIYGTYSFIDNTNLLFTTTDKYYEPKIDENILKLSYKVNDKLITTSGKILKISKETNIKKIVIKIKG